MGSNYYTRRVSRFKKGQKIPQPILSLFQGFEPWSIKSSGLPSTCPSNHCGAIILPAGFFVWKRDSTVPFPGILTLECQTPRVTIYLPLQLMGSNYFTRRVSRFKKGQKIPQPILSLLQGFEPWSVKPPGLPSTCPSNHCGAVILPAGFLVWKRDSTVPFPGISTLECQTPRVTIYLPLQLMGSNYFTRRVSLFKKGQKIPQPMLSLFQGFEPWSVKPPGLPSTWPSNHCEAISLPAGFLVSKRDRKALTPDLSLFQGFEPWRVKAQTFDYFTQLNYNWGILHFQGCLATKRDGKGQKRDRICPFSRDLDPGMSKRKPDLCTWISFVSTRN